MKNVFVTLLALLFTAISFGHNDENDPVVLTIDGEGIHASEFLYIYTKNNADPSFKKKDLDEYMELFINYKLKVKEAERLGYDTIPKLKQELEQYRRQLALPYMVDKKQSEKLIEEAYFRTKNEVHASHILIRVSPEASPEDTLKAWNNIMELRQRILDGEDFGEVAAGKGGSQDPSAKMNKGDLGYFSALQMVYPFEEAAFNTEIGKVSMPIRTRYGYHIIQTHDLREAKGKIQAAHIMVLVNFDASREEIDAAEQKINEIYELLENGEKFEVLAKKYSDDQSSKSRGGVLPEFGAGAKQRMVPSFEEAVFALQADGEYTKPIRTPYGFHIIKRIKLTPVPTYEEMYRELKLKVEKDVRAQQTRNSFLNKLKKEYNFEDANAQKLLPMFYNTMGDEYFMGRWKGLESDAHKDEILFSFADQFYTVGDFEKYLLTFQNAGKPRPMKGFIEEQFKIWSTLKLTEYEDSKLEEKYPEFKALVQEYRDGILVFEIMQNEIWNKAANDTVGIKKYYNEHRSDFTYPVRYKGELYKCKDKETAERVYEMVESDTITYGQIQEVINANSTLNLLVRSHTFNSETTDAFKKGKKIRKFKEGLNKIFEKDGEFYVFDVAEVLPPREREFSEAKGLVTAAYQNELEKRWLEELRKSHTIEVHQEALYSVEDFADNN
ncbi:MAG: peptidylprolyl isomerase [Crocinitomicaceae bacterium]|nr:peptidylprolyl isomerase [Crocinitomicaceae bacterium]